MKYYVEKDPADFDFWGGACDRMDGATEKQKQIVYKEDSAGSLY